METQEKPMKVGDLIKHKYGTLLGRGLVLGFNKNRCHIMWCCHGNSNVMLLNISSRWFEVISESR